jgi:hypothetical protein
MPLPGFDRSKLPLSAGSVVRLSLPVTFFWPETSNVRGNNREGKRETKSDEIKISGPAKNNVDQDDFYGSAATAYPFDER